MRSLHNAVEPVRPSKSSNELLGFAAAREIGRIRPHAPALQQARYADTRAGDKLRQFGGRFGKIAVAEIKAHQQRLGAASRAFKHQR